MVPDLEGHPSSWSGLIDAARAVRERAHAPFSGFHVGAALEDENGRVFTGCNVENATFGLSLCAERVAVFKAISEGAGKIRRIAVVADTPVLTPPCGACRQILYEFCEGADLVLANLGGQQEVYPLADFLPKPFGAGFFVKGMRAD